VHQCTPCGAFLGPKIPASQSGYCPTTPSFTLRWTKRRFAGTILFAGKARTAPRSSQNPACPRHVWGPCAAEMSLSGKGLVRQNREPGVASVSPGAICIESSRALRFR
jgi:hypothetical protein